MANCDRQAMSNIGGEIIFEETKQQINTDKHR